MSGADGTRAGLTVEAFDHIVLNVTDVDAAADWYVRVLGMERRDTPHADGSRRTSVHFGRNKMNLRPISASHDAWFTGRSPQPGSDDLCFLTTNGPDDVAAHMRARGVAIERGPVDRHGAMGTIRSVYVRDTDGNLVEVSSYV